MKQGIGSQKLAVRLYRHRTLSPTKRSRHSCTHGSRRLEERHWWLPDMPWLDSETRAGPIDHYFLSEHWALKHPSEEDQQFWLFSVWVCTSYRICRYRCGLHRISLLMGIHPACPVCLIVAASLVAVETDVGETISAAKVAFVCGLWSVGVVALISAGPFSYFTSFSPAPNILRDVRKQGHMMLICDQAPGLGRGTLSSGWFCGIKWTEYLTCMTVVLLRSQLYLGFTIFGEIFVYVTCFLIQP